MTVRLIRFNEEIFSRMALSDLDKERIRLMHDCQKNLFGGNTCFIAVDGNLPLGIGGIDILWMSDRGRAMGEAWIRVLEFPILSPSQRFQAARLIRRCFELLLHVHPFYRIQCGIELGNFQAQKLVEFLGFKPEAILHHFLSNEQDVILYALYERFSWPGGSPQRDAPGCADSPGEDSGGGEGGPSDCTLVGTPARTESG